MTQKFLVTRLRTSHIWKGGGVFPNKKAVLQQYPTPRISLIPYPSLTFFTPLYIADACTMQPSSTLSSIYDAVIIIIHVQCIRVRCNF